MSPEAQSKVDELRKALRCLYLEVPAHIAADVEQRAEAVISELEQEQSSLPPTNDNPQLQALKEAAGQFDSPRMTFMD